VRRDERQYAVPLILSTFLALCVFADVGRGQITLLNPDRQMGSIRLARISVGAFLWEARQHRKIECLARLQQDSRTVGASSKLPVWMKSSSVQRNQPNIVLVMVESWGQPVSRDIGDALLAPYKDASISRAYKMETGVVSFHGPTIDAETRELCSDELGFGVITAPASSFRDCLPMRLARRGYYTTAVHGFSGRMFKRDDWYRKARFDEAWFREQLQPRGLSMCPGPFPGICDAAVGEWIGNRLEEGRNAPQFIYWVTLNSHLPVPVPNQVEDSPSCSGSAEISDNAAECSWYQLVYNVHRSVSKLAAKVASRPTMFVIVGDHAPPFSQPELKERFSESVVPYIVLSSKYGAADAPLQSNRSIASRSNHQAGYAKHHKKKTEPASSAEGGENTGGA
jgi:phosphoglycerol transferase MdoB-like AlkP superfamily enzyme